MLGQSYLATAHAQGIAGRALVISAGIIANIIFAYSILLAQVRSPTPTCLSDTLLWALWRVLFSNSSVATNMVRGDSAILVS